MLDGTPPPITSGADAVVEVHDAVPEANFYMTGGIESVSQS